MKIGARVLDLGLGKFFGPSWPKTSFQAPDLGVKVPFNILGVH